MRRFILASLCLALAACACAKTPPTRLDVTAQPEGAQVVIDGVLRGLAPLQLFDLKPGRHLVHVQAPGYEACDAFVTLNAGDFVQKNWALKREKALLLLRTEPAGAEVRYNGVTLGTTPYLATTFNTGASYVLELARNGYRTKKIDVKLADRTPVVRTESLVLDSGIVKCETTPSGATVLVNGIERGVTPLVADDVPKGLAVITFRLAGYREVSREVRLAAGEQRNLALTLAPQPATLKVISTPEGARVFVDDSYQGKTPLVVSSVKPGMRTLKVEREGYAPLVKTLEAANGAELTETLVLQSVLGRVHVVTIPGGAKISIDGKALGTTKIRSGSPRSDVLSLENIPAGEHMLLVRCPGHQDITRRITVQAQKTLELNLRLPRVFAPDTEVETTRGIYRGVLVSSSPEGLTIETKPGIMQTFPQSDIRRTTPIK